MELENALSIITFEDWWSKHAIQQNLSRKNMMIQAWNYQQSRVDALQAKIEKLSEQLYLCQVDREELETERSNGNENI